ncbi:hypothetical protein KGY79_12650 [Candidatus Bipolaricaulota bacterium]|nr:hypothetical protein [Candidatus Bipolaricaulota bacterium]
MKIEDSEYFEISGANRIVFKNGKYSGQTLDEVRLVSKFYLPYLKFRANSSVDKKILKEVLAGKEERNIYEQYFATEES